MPINPALYHFTIYNNDTFKWEMTMKQGGVVVDLSGYSGILECKENYSDEEPIMIASTENGLMTLDDEGLISIIVTSDLTSEMAFSAPRITGVFDLHIWQGTDSVIRLVSGTFNIEKSASVFEA